MQVFADSVAALRAQLAVAGDALVWDKDERHALDFVTACANVRAHIFNIPLKSRFEVKCKTLHIHILQAFINPSFHFQCFTVTRFC